ncbi:AAA family ATPase [Candidatus Poribacteria bacterium]|nr:AAA family ATPase [Candidatus Poribacteria bacterium]MYK18823.1 AAA family ATPase [Candidatus Poribacteria bacterium]
MSEEKLEGITKITVKGFKSIAEECEIDIYPLTLLAGANSSGKSSIMQPLLMLKQTLEVPYDPGPLLIDGPNVQFTEMSQFLSKLTDGKKTDRFQVRIENRVYDVFYSVKTTFRKGSDGIEIVEMTREIKSTVDPSSPSLHLTLYPEMPLEEAISRIDQYPMSRDFKGVKRFRCFLGFEAPDGRGLYDVTYPLEPSILNTIHLPGLRGNPERTYKLSSTGPQYPGTFENYAASVIHKWQDAKDERLKTLGDALHILRLTGKVSTQKVGDVSIEVQVGRLPHGRTGETDMVNIADVGIGVSQLLPVIVALVAAEPGRLVYIEQPELHLHPRAQVALAQVLADAAKRGVRVVVETHSSLLLLGVQTLVAEGDLSPELVKLHWFTRREDGVTEVNSADLDEAGAYGEWPEDFDDVDLKAQSRYIKAAQSRFIEGT